MSRPTPEPSRCLPPVVDARVRLLILGSLPGVQSLRAERYYAHPQNGFWRLLEGVIGVPLDDLDYAGRLETIASRGVGLWDVVAEAQRPGSLDAAMRDIAPNALPALLATLPQLRAIAFNGATAARIGRRVLGNVSVALIDLPSSSPAYTLSPDRKAERWAVLSSFIDSTPLDPDAPKI